MGGRTVGQIDRQTGKQSDRVKVTLICVSHQNIPGNTLGRTKTDNISQVITVTDDFDSHQL